MHRHFGLSRNYHFVTQSKSERGSESKGCEQCLKYRPYLNHRFFICIDSDLRLLRGEVGLTRDNFIGQTYAYSWENHACEAGHLERRFREKVPDSQFSFVSFLTELSNIVYKPLLYLVYYKTPELNTQWNVSKFNSCMPLQPNRKELEDNGLPYLQKVRDLFDEKMDSLNLPVDYTIDGLTPGNAYLHIQGHRLYDLVLNIGTLLCRGKRVKFKSEVLDKDFPNSGYVEIENVNYDLTTILNG